MGSGTAEGSLLGREAELETLRELIHSSRRRDRVLLLEGEPGIGKTALLKAARDEATRAGLTVLSAVGVEAETELPFAGVVQLLAPVQDRIAGIGPAHRDALLTAFGVDEGPPPSLYLIAEAVQALVDPECAGAQEQPRDQRPVLLLVDDVQWLDPQSHEVLASLVRDATTKRLTLVGTVRSGHQGPLLDADVPRLTLRGLDQGNSVKLVERSGARLSTRDMERIVDEARGNPLALMELPKEWRPGLPDDRQTLSGRLERAFAGRVNDLPSDSRDLLLVAAIDPIGDVEEILAAAALLAGHQVDRHALDEAASVGLVLVDGDRLEFRHPLVRSGILQAEPVGRKQAAHAALADSLAGEPLRQIWHRAESIVGPDDHVADMLESIAPELLRRGAVQTAVAALERSAELTSSSSLRGHRLLVAAEHAFDMGRNDIVDRLVNDAARTQLSELDNARLQWVREIFHDGLPGDAVRVNGLCAMARVAAASSDHHLALNLLLGAALRCWWADTGPQARADVASTLDQLSVSTADPRYVAALAVAEPVLRAREVIERLDRTDLSAVQDADSLRLHGMAAHAVGDTVRATDILDRAEELLRKRALLGLLPHVLGMQVNIRRELGDWEGATAAMCEVHRLAKDTGQPIWSLNNQILDAHARALSGAWEQAMDILASTEVEANRQRLNDTLCLHQLARGVALLVSGRAEEAYSCLRRQFDPADPAYHQREGMASLTFLAEAAVAADRIQDATVVLHQMERLAVVTPAPLLRVHLDYARAVLVADDQAGDRFAEARRTDLSRWPWHQARLSAAYGRWLARTGQAHSAREALAAAARGFDAIGASYWAARTREHLDALNESTLEARNGSL